MKVAERHNKILTLVKRRPYTVEDMALELHVSPVTVRRDLSHLADQGLLTRTLGGAAAAISLAERSLEQRAMHAQEEKQRIAEAAVKKIVPGQTVFLDSGTSTGALADKIADQAAQSLPGLTVVTASLSVAAKLCEVPPLKLILLGGELRQLSQGMLGPLTERALESLTFDIAFLSGDALSPTHGIGETAPGQTRLKELIMRKSAITVALGHGEKLDRLDTHHWAALPVGSILITDTSGAPMAKQFQQNGITLFAV